VTSDHPAWSLFLAHQVIKETLSSLATTNSLNTVLGADTRLL
jgi:hypothetical protein